MPGQGRGVFGKKVISVNISINESPRTYVVQNPIGVSSIGFDIIRTMVEKFCEIMSVAVPKVETGSPELFQIYQGLMERFKRHPENKQTWFQLGTDQAVVKLLSQVIADHSVLRLFKENPKTSYDWGDSNNVVGFIGRMNGLQKPTADGGLPSSGRKFRVCKLWRCN